MEKINIPDGTDTRVYFDGIYAKTCQGLSMQGTTRFPNPQALNCIRGSFTNLLLEGGAGHYLKEWKEVDVICANEFHNKVRLLTLKNVSVVGYSTSFSIDDLVFIEKYDFIAMEFIPGSEIKEEK